ncbi:FAD-binding oxidoreductase [Pseudokineococcus basanitobsidens]|uniref:FAD-binding oxidoreductase n=1 Tax=Pseudokineococcus basanitobsidens TaxID=1926649 RepID=A0ABU8RP33_9ACTN
MTEAAGSPEPGPSAPPTSWRPAVVREVHHPSPRAVSVRLDLPGRRPHRPGQHYVLRLTAPDGYRAQRSYSVASAPDDELLELYVERLPDGEVSGFLAEELAVGDELEVRGPVGEWFAWDGRPALAVGGGSGVVPLVAMLRHAAALGRPDALRLAVAARTREDLPYADELEAAGALVALSREPAGRRPAGRLRSSELERLVEPGRTAFVCGSAAFAEASSRQLVALGVLASDVRVERFGASG